MLRRFRAGILAGLAAILLVLAFGQASAHAAAPTVVSLTFDDGTATQYFARKELSQHNMHGTFYINSSRTGTDPYYMTWNQIQGLASDGNEIGGHTAMHVNLPQTDPDEARRQICDDRDNLVDKGLNPTDFAYPYGAKTDAVKQMVQDCGYNSARGVDEFGANCTTQCSETMPPRDLWNIQQGTGDTSLTNIENVVLKAEQNGGGWVPITFHQLCNACDTNYVTQANFSAFLDWLQARQANGTTVETVKDVIGGAVKPKVAGPPPPPAASGYNGLRNASFEVDANGDKTPDCWDYDAFGTNTANWSRTSDAHSGSWAERVDVTNYTDGDNKLMTHQDLGNCTPTVIPGHKYRVTAWYKSDHPVRFTAFQRDSALGSFSYFDNSADFPASSTYTQATWTTSAIPAGTNGLTVGLTLPSAGSMTFDDIGITDAAATSNADTTPPTVALTSPKTGDTLAGLTTLGATASDNGTIDHVDFLVDGSVVGTQTSGPYSYDWNSRSVPNGTHTVSVRAVDTAGNAKTTTAATVNVSNSTVNLLKNPSLEAATGSTPNCWLLGGFGNNAFTWTRTSDAHDGSFGENLTVTSLTDGDRKLVGTQDAGACAAPAIPGHTYSVSGWYRTPGVTSSPTIYAFYRNSAGQWIFWGRSPVLANSFTWNQATWRTPAVPAGATALSVGMGMSAAGNVTMDDFSLQDNAPPPDTTPPTSTISCNGGTADSGGCSSGYYGGSVQVSLSATDDPGGSGVDQIRYTTDGSDPTATNGTVYSGAFTVGTTSTVKYRAFDKAGNAEPVRSQTIQVDSANPTTTMHCDGNPCGTSWYRTGVSVDLSAVDTGGAGVRDIRYTTDGSDPTLDNGNSYVGPFSVTSTSTVKYRAYDEAGNEEPINTQQVNVDPTSPTSAISCGDAFTPCPSSVNGGTDVYLSSSDADSGVTSIRYTTDGTDPTATNGTTYVGPFHIDSTTLVKYRAYDAAGNVEPINGKLIQVPTATVALASPTDGAVLSGTTALSATVGGIDVDHVDFLVDDQVVGTATSSPYGISWDSTTVPDGAHTVQAHVFDANVVETDSPVSNVTVDNSSPDTTPPTSSATCDNNPCQPGFYSSGVSVRLAADDGPGGSGVKQIRYTTDGSDPTATTGTVYSGPVGITKTTTVKYLAIDTAGNVEPVHTQQVNVDTISPSSSIKCNTVSCAGTYYRTPVSVSLAGTDSGGSGLDAVRYTTDGTDPTTTNGTTYTAPFTVDATKTVKYRAFDKAGNAEPVNSALLKVDSVPPSSSAACNGGTCAGWFKPGASLVLSATDNDSGVASIRYTTNGTDPTATTGTVYASPLPINATTTVKYRAFDKAGNTEAVNTQTVQIDGTAPTVNLTAPTAGSIAAGGTAITASANDNVAVDHVDFLVDGTKVGTATNAPYTFNWDSTTVHDGVHKITAVAVDGAGNTTTSGQVSVTVTNVNLLKNPSLETATGTTPTCWTLGGFGNNTPTWTRTSDAHTGNFAETLAIGAYTDGDRKLVNTQDTGTCAPAATAGKTYTVTFWYKGTGQPVIFAYTRINGTWAYWAQSPKLPSASTWTQASWTTPAVPSGTTHISLGPGLNAGNASVTMDDIGLFEQDSAPTVVLNPLPSAVSGSVSLSATAAPGPGGSSVASVKFQRSPKGANTWSDVCTSTSPSAGSTYSCNWGTTGVSDGSYDLRAIATNQAGLATTSDVMSGRLVDNTPPSVSLSVPSSGGAFLGVDPTLTAASDDGGGSGVKQVQIQYKLHTDPESAWVTPAGCAMTVGPYACTLPTSALTDGSQYDIRAVATDNAGSSGPSQVLTRTLDKSPPAAPTLNAPGAEPYAGTVTFSGTGSDAPGGSGLASWNVQYRRSGQGQWVTACTSATPTSGNAFGCSFDTTQLADGTYDFRALAIDKAGNATAMSDSDILSAKKLDNNPPTVTMQDPGVLAGTHATVSGLATDGSTPIAKVVFQRSAKGANTWSDVCTTTSPSAGSTYSCDWDTTGVGDGSYDLRAVVTDQAGRATTSDVMSGRLVDNTPPSVSLSVPSAEFLGLDPTLTATSDDGGGSGIKQVQIQYKLHTDPDSAWVTPAGCAMTVGPYACTLPTSALTDGQYDLRAVATDNAGSSGPSQVLTRTLDKSPPAAPTLDAPGTEPYAGTVTFSGTGSDAPGGSGLASWNVQYRLAGQGQWVTGCTSTTPTSGNAFGCSFDTTQLADGTYDFRALAIDKAGNATAGDVLSAKKIDNNPPTVTMQDPGVLAGTHATLSGLATDGSTPITKVAFQRSPAGAGAWSTDCTATTAATDGTYSCAFDSTAQADGRYDFRAIATDAVGKSGTSAVIAGRWIDNTAPTSGPMGDPGATLTGKVTLSGPASDGGSGIASVTFQRAAAGSSTWTNACIPTGSTSPYSCSWDTTGVADGSYDLREVTTDRAGNVTTSPVQASRTVDNNAPTVSLNDPGANLQGTSARLTATASDAGSGIKQVLIQRSPAGSGTWTDVCTSTTAPYGCALDTTKLADGLYDFRATATDGIGNTATSGIVASRRVDNTAPTSGPMTDPGSPLAGSVTLSGSASDAGSGVASVKFQRAPTGGSNWTDICSSTGSTGTYTCSWNTSSTSDGGYDLREVTTDKAGNVTTSTVIKNRAVDNTAPTTTLSDPGSPIRATVTLTATATDAGGVKSVKIQRSAAGQNTWTDVCSDTTTPYSCSLDTTKLADGTYDFRAVATDTANNSATSNVVASRKVDNTKPTATAFAAANKTGLAGFLDQGDIATFTFSEPIDPTSVLAGWDGSAAKGAVTVQVSTSAGNNVLTVWDAANKNQTKLGSVTIGNYVAAASTFKGTLTQSGNDITLTLGTLLTGKLQTNPAPLGTMKWTPAGVTDLAGNNLTNATVSVAGQRF